MLLADADVFWKWPPTVYDAVGVVSFVAGLVSIWVSWWLARRDLEARIRQAELRAVATIQRLMLQAAVTEVRRHVELAREAQEAANWPKALVHTEEAHGRLSELLSNPGLAQSDRDTLRLSVDRLTALAGAVQKQRRSKQGQLTDADRALIGTVLAELRSVEGELNRTTADQP